MDTPGCKIQSPGCVLWLCAESRLKIHMLARRGIHDENNRLRNSNEFHHRTQTLIRAFATVARLAKTCHSPDCPITSNHFINSASNLSVSNSAQADVNLPSLQQLDRYASPWLLQQLALALRQTSVIMSNLLSAPIP